MIKHLTNWLKNEKKKQNYKSLKRADEKLKYKNKRVSLSKAIQH